MSKEDEVRQDFATYSTHWEGLSDDLTEESLDMPDDAREDLLDRSEEISKYLGEVEALIEAGDYEKADEMMKDKPVDD